MRKLKAIILSIIFILTGSLVFFYNGYKANRFLDIISYLLILVGWIVILFSFFGRKLLKNKRVSFKKNKFSWVRQKAFAVSCYLVFGVLVVFNLILVTNLTNRRVYTILHNNNTKETTAIVIKLEDRNSRNGKKSYAIIKYQTDNKTIEQAIYNGYTPKFSVGQKLLITYSVVHPEMFEVINRNE
jgi:L-asparagine transporter-like permease